MISSHVSRLIKSFSLFFFVVACGGVFYFYQSHLCSSPIAYKIGTFDTRFGITKEEFIKSLATAGQVWGKPFNKTFFTYDPKGAITVNLIYDTRQESTQKNAILQKNVGQIKNASEAVKAQYTALQNDYDKSRQAYNSELDDYQNRESAYTTKVEYWNNQGGAPEAEYAQLTQEQQQLIAERAILENKRVTMNALADQINAFIKKYNLLITDANAAIHTINQSAGKEFEEGEYISAKGEINIYEFNTREKLIRVLAHEFGHALGLDHNDNPLSIMYPVNQASTLSLSQDDKDALKIRCKLP